MKMLAIGAYRDEAVLIGTEDSRTVCYQAIEHFRVRMMKRILKDVGDDGEGGRDRVKERLDGGCLAAMVADFQDIGAHGPSVFEDASLHRLLVIVRVGQDVTDSFRVDCP